MPTNGSRHLQKVREYYDRTGLHYRIFWSSLYKHGGYYDLEAHTHRQSLTRLLEVIWDLAGTQRGMVVLDAGCGFGGTPIWLEQHGVHCVGISLSPSEIAKANVNARTHYTSPKLLVSDYTNTDLQDEQFDQVWAIESLCHAEDKRAFFHEAWRILKPYGRVVIADALAMTDTLSDDLRVWMNTWAIPNLLHTRTVDQLVLDARFRKLAFPDLSPHMLPTVHRMVHLLRYLTPVLWIIDRFSANQRSYRKGTWGMVNSFMTGEWQYRVLVAEKGA